MKFDEQRTIICPTVTQSVMIVSDVRFIRESLSAVFARVSTIRFSCVATDLCDARSAITADIPDVILLDVAVPNGLQMVMELRQLFPGASVVALGLRERDEDVLTWAEAGIVGYVPNTSFISEMPPQSIRSHFQGWKTSSSTGAPLLSNIPEEIPQKTAPVTLKIT